MSPSVLQSLNRLPRRWWSAGARFALGLGSLGALAAACSDPASPPGYREYTSPGGSGGAGAAGKAGASMAASGEGGEGPGGAPDGGTSAQGGGGGGGRGGVNAGSGGGPVGGKGGNGGSSGGPASTCGNGTTDPGEDCDDGNLVDLDGCSSTCKTKCEECLDRFYGDDPEYEFFVDSFKNSMEPAIEGPGLSTPRSILAQKLMTCIVQSECVLKDRNLEGGCLCGTASTAECADGMGNGACLDEFGDAAEGKDYATISARLSNFTLAVGWASEVAQVMGSRGYCVGVCQENRALTACELCLAGDNTGLVVPTTGCTACLTPGVCDDPLIACVDQKCAGGDLEPCLKRPTKMDDLTQPWPCRDAAIAAVDVARFDASVDFLRCRASQCKDECDAP